MKETSAKPSLISGQKNLGWFLSNPWSFFIVFLIANFLIADGSLSLKTKLEIGFFTLLIPFVWKSFSPGAVTFDPTARENEFLPSIPVWAWTLLVGTALFMRLYRINTPSSWPNYEEGTYGYFALELLKQWNGRLFWGSADSPAGYIWSLCAIFKVFGPSLWVLRLYPALVTFLTVLMGYFAARLFFSKSVSFLTALFLSGSFWPVYLGYFSQPVVWLPLWECLSLFLLGLFLKSLPKNQNKWSFLFGLSVGAGFYIYTSWAIVALVMGLSMLAVGYQKKAGSAFCFFILPILLLVFPLVLAARNENYGAYLRALWAFSNPEPLMDQLKNSLSYIFLLFGNLSDLPRLYLYGPMKGGFFNPFLTSGFLLGLSNLIKNRFNSLNQWLLWSLFIFFLPALLTKSLEPFRLVPLMVIILIIAALGFISLLSARPQKGSIGLILIFFIVSTGLDFYQLDLYRQRDTTPALFQPYLKSSERWEAYQILNQQSRESGPGFIFSDFVPGFCDETLTLADDAFNVNENPALSPASASWAAVITYADEKPFLTERFPDGKAYFISKDVKRPDGGWMLWMMPVNPQRRETFLLWQKASLSLKPYIHQCLSYRWGTSFQPAVDALLSAYPFFQGDPFLESSFWEMAADCSFKKGPSPDYKESIQYMEKALKNAYPSAHLYYSLGIYCLMDQNPVEARKAFDLARKAPLNLTDADQLLQKLK